MKPGDQIRFAVRDLDEDGSGFGPVPTERDHRFAPDGPAGELHVAGALPGEDVTACVEHVSTHGPVAWGSLRIIHAPSPDRVAPACAAYGRCGGCVMQHLDVRAQLAWKAAWFRRLAEGNPVAAVRDAHITAAVPSPLALGYRNNSKLIAARDAGGGMVLGAYAPRSHDVVGLDGCAITESALGRVSAALRDALQAHQVEPYDEIRQGGILRYAVLRANVDGQVLVTLVTATDSFAAGAAVATTICHAHPEIAGVVQNINPSRGNALYGDGQRTLIGASTIEDRIGDVRLRISSRAFFQANRQVARLAYDAIARGLAPRDQDIVVDAYAGVGGIALTLAPSVHSVLGIEEHASAVEDATIAARLNGVANARFVAADVSRALQDVDRADIVVLNPPRKGCSADVLARTAALAPRAIAYLSCAPKTLLRDLGVLANQGGYTAIVLTPLDMLPHTTHLEVLAIVVRPSPP